MFEFIHQIETLTNQLGSTPWLLLLVLGFIAVDGVFPPVPGEAVLITAAVMAASGSGPPLALIIAVAAVAALLGDVLAFTLGGRLPLHRLRGLRGKGRRQGRGAVLDRAARVLDRRGAMLVVVGRFIPIGRVALFLGAGALGFPRARFVVAAAIGGLLWASYTAALGIGAQSLLGGSTPLSIGLGILAGLATGAVVEAVWRKLEPGRDNHGERDGGGEFAPHPTMASQVPPT